ncbi:unnamed protein product [Ilex paraguariensis]|uniref:Uncharacterized protein n=1 Tax=Ilex paraguariensis TaxID=185542 RepID=A0ABC8SVT2_9AQUA
MLEKRTTCWLAFEKLRNYMTTCMTNFFPELVVARPSCTFGFIPLEDFDHGIYDSPELNRYEVRAYTSEMCPTWMAKEGTEHQARDIVPLEFCKIILEAKAWHFSFVQVYLDFWESRAVLVGIKPNLTLVSFS